ncbi:MAG TPA: hypothetical protein VGC76_07615 [Pyrinomonadaceae bacterium]|jgi:hypothetical protein
MRNFKIFQPSSDDSYWYELYKYAQPYAFIGTATLKALIHFLQEADFKTAERLFFRDMEGLYLQVRRIKESLGKVNDTALKERSMEVLFYKESLDEYFGIQNKAILGGVLEESLITKEKIAPYHSDDQAPIEYYHVYNTLKFALLPLRAATFFLYNRPLDEVIPLFKQEIIDFLENEARGIEVAQTIGRNRVSPMHQELYVADELGPKWGTEFWIAVDGKTVYVDDFSPVSIPKTEVGAIRNQARQKHAELLDSSAEEVAKDIREAYNTAKTVTG